MFYHSNGHPQVLATPAPQSVNKESGSSSKEAQSSLRTLRRLSRPPIAHQVQCCRGHSYEGRSGLQHNKQAAAAESAARRADAQRMCAACQSTRADSELCTLAAHALVTYIHMLAAGPHHSRHAWHPLLRLAEQLPQLRLLILSRHAKHARLQAGQQSSRQSAAAAGKMLGTASMHTAGPRRNTARKQMAQPPHSRQPFSNTQKRSSLVAPVRSNYSVHRTGCTPGLCAAPPMPAKPIHKHIRMHIPASGHTPHRRTFSAAMLTARH
jgi:hypothetical protein